jgi:hypothetical protein
VTARRDEVQTARDARQTGLRRAAQLAADLAAIPGWVQVGDPVRLTDPADQAAARQAAGLVADLVATHRGVAALDAELDALDGTRPAPALRFVEWSNWLAGVPDATTLLAQLIPDPRRQFLGAEPAMTQATAQRIVDTVAANGGHVGDGQLFVTDAALADDDVFDLEHTAMVRLDPLPADQSIGVLLPLRLETRFRRPAAAGDPWRLRIRVYPDPVALAAPPSTPTQAEADLVASCWSRCAGELSGDAGEAAFRSLASAVGGGRAAYLLRTVPVIRSSTEFVADGAFRTSGVVTDGYRAALPDVLQVWGDTGTGLTLLGELTPNLAEIAAQTDLGTAMADMRADQVPKKWWTSYQAALDVGLAIEIAVPDGPGGPPGPHGPTLSVLLVTGLADREMRPVLQALADNSTLAVVTPMSPTNTVAGAAAADLGHDAATWLQVASTVGAGSANGLAEVLTGQPLLDGVPAADTSLHTAIPPLVAALWPVLWQRWLKDVEGLGIEVMRMGDWAARVLAPLGPFPAIRVGDVPYGVLPGVDLSTWVSPPGDPVWESAIAAIFGNSRAGAPDVIAAWAAAGVAGGSAQGADADRLLDIIGRVPTSHQIGSRIYHPLEAIALSRAAALGTDPLQVVQEWRGAAEILSFAPDPTRRYQPFGYIQPAAAGGGPLGELLDQYLKTSWEELAYGAQKDGQPDKSPLLARLIRQALLLTQAEVSRLDDGHWPSWTAPYLLPLDHAEQLAQDAARGPAVLRLPDYAQQRLDSQYPPDPRVEAIVRQFHDVRNAVQQLAQLGDALLDGHPLAAAVTAVIDASSHRVDPWITALGTRRLRRLNARNVPRRLGAYGWVDDLSPALDPTPPTSAGLLHAPGHAQALTAAVLRDHAVHDDDARWQITARSDLVRLAARIGDDVRLGIHLSESLGREIERRAGDPAAVLSLRRRFPPRPEQAGRRVCDGLAVLDAAPALVPPETGPLDDLRQVLDTYADLLVADAVHDVVSGRAAQAQESMQAAAGLGAPPEFRLLRTQRQGATIRTTVLIALPPANPDPASPAALADPALAALLTTEFGPPADWTWTTAGGGAVTLADLGLDVPDVALIPQPRLDTIASGLLGSPVSGGTAASKRPQLDRVCSLLGAQRDPTDLIGDREIAAAEIRARITALRAAAATVLADLSADPPIASGARRWGLPDDATEAARTLTARLDQIGPELTDGVADFGTLADRIRTLLAPASPLPVTYTATLPAVVAAALDRDWLEILAAVRPALARLEAHQLNRGWPAAATNPDAMWSVPTNGDRQVVVYGPAAQAGGPVAVALVDDWAETVPSTRHTTHTSFGFDAPRSRAPQALLLAIPPNEAVALTAEALPAIVLSAREQARARMAQPDQLADWSLAVPMSMVLLTGPAGESLVNP